MCIKKSDDISITLLMLRGGKEIEQKRPLPYLAKGNRTKAQDLSKGLVMSKTDLVGWKFLRRGQKGKPVSHFDGSPWVVNEWRKQEGNLTKGVLGLSCSPTITQAIMFVQGEILAEVEHDNEFLVSSEGHTTSRAMRILRTWEWNRKDSVKMVLNAAKRVLPIFESSYPDDYEPHTNIAAVGRWLAGIGSWKECERTRRTEYEIHSADEAALAAHLAAVYTSGITHVLASALLSAVFAEKSTSIFEYLHKDALEGLTEIYFPHNNP